jgi:glycosyltransferase involved in cell wall biosynthesis
LLGIEFSEEIAVMIAEDLSDPNKNIQEFVNKILDLRKKFRKIRIVLVGGSSQRIIGPEDIIYKVGSLSSQELSRILPAADYLVVPSKMETAPSIILEAAAVGVPCLVAAGNVGGVEMAEKFGLGVVSYGDSDLSSSLTQLVSLRKNHSNQIRDRALRLAGSEQVIKRYLDLYFS